jgi:hypothetical protein
MGLKQVLAKLHAGLYAKYGQKRQSEIFVSHIPCNASQPENTVNQMLILLKEGGVKLIKALEISGVAGL